MKYALLNTANEVIRTQDFADAPPTLPEAKGLRWLEYVEASQPAFDPMTQRVEAALPVVDSKYTTVWQIVALNAATIAAKQAEAESRRIASLWQAAHDLEYAAISGSAIGLITMGVLQAKPKCLTVQGWIKSIWTEYYTRKATASSDYDFSGAGPCPHTVPELMVELGL